MDLRQYRPNDWEWYSRYKEKYGPEAFQQYKNKIFKMLEELKPGRLYDFTEAEAKGSKIFIVTFEDNGTPRQEANPDLFVKLCCMFIESCHDYEFSDDYNKIKRTI